MLQAQAETLRRKEIAEVIAKVKEAIAHYGLSAADLGFEKGIPRTGKVASTPGKRGRKSAVAKPAVRAVKFRDDQGHTWGGIGKRPEWFKAALAAGKKPQDLLAKG